MHEEPPPRPLGCGGPAHAQDGAGDAGGGLRGARRRAWAALGPAAPPAALPRLRCGDPGRRRRLGGQRQPGRAGPRGGPPRPPPWSRRGALTGSLSLCPPRSWCAGGTSSPGSATPWPGRRGPPCSCWRPRRGCARLWWRLSPVRALPRPGAAAGGRTGPSPRRSAPVQLLCLGSQKQQQQKSQRKNTEVPHAVLAAFCARCGFTPCGELPDI